MARKANAYLGSVDELSQRDVCVMAKDVEILEPFGSAVLELDADEVAEVRGRSSAQLNGNCGGVVGCRELS